MGSIWIAILSVSDATAAKIEGKHAISLRRLRDAIVGVADLPFRWDDHPSRGRRAVVTVHMNGHMVAVVLYPAGDDTWNLGSAYRI